MEEQIAKIEKIVSDGYGLSRKENEKINFIKFTIPGEIVEYEIEKEKKNHIISHPTRIIEKSPLRIHPKCKYFYKCGGCDFQHIKYTEHKQIKINILKELFKKNAKYEILESIDYYYSTPFNYRNKITLFVNNDKLGFKQKKSNNIIYIDNCNIARKSINTLIKKLLEMNHIFKYIEKIQIQITHSGNILLTIISKLEHYNKEFDDLFLLNIPHIIIVLSNKKFFPLKGKGILQETYFSIPFTYSYANFMQINHQIAEQMLDFIDKFINKENTSLIDLYSGVGIFSIFFANKFKNVFSVEGNKSSVYFQRLNIKKNKLKHIKVINKFIDNNYKVLDDTYFDIAIADPPREGIAGLFLQNILPKINKKFIYISCNASTLARDSKIIFENNFEIEKIALFDMFPQTHHFESIIIFKRK